MISEHHRLLEITKILRQNAQSSCHRRLLVCSGQAQWCRDQAAAFMANAEETLTVYIGDGFESRYLPGVDVIPASRAKEWLGREIKTLVFDGYSGFDVDAFGVICGSLCAGGVLLLLVPDLSSWPQYADPEHRRMVVYPQTLEQVTGRYLKRFADLVYESSLLSLLLESGESKLQATTLSKNEHRQPAVAPYKTACQSKAVAAIHKVVRGHRKRPLVITADRGRGKSAALGIAAGQLLLEGINHITVTAPSKRAVDVIFAHAKQVLADNAKLFIDKINFFAPDDLVNPDEFIAGIPTTDLLLVDEAAAIPLPLLEAMLSNYSRIVFATTVHGYEGAGRGFAIRFRETLNTKTPQWRELKMEEPIRWYSGDPVEAFVFQALLLNAAPCHGRELTGITSGACHFRQLSQNELLSDESLLTEIFGLLVLAHYQTRPFDLRHLLDGGNIEVYGLFYRNHLVATALAAREGSLEHSLIDGILLGHRRVRGHLLPQSLSHHLGIESAITLKGLRIIRIAVHPDCQGIGLGKKLMANIIEKSHNRDLDYLGTLYGATDKLLRFWHSVGLLPVRVGITKDATSGAYSVMMLQALSDQGDALTKEATVCFKSQFYWLLMDILRNIDVSLVSSLIRYSSFALDYKLSSRDRADLVSFALGARAYESCVGTIKQLVLMALSNDLVKDDEQLLLISKVLQNQCWQQVVKRCGLLGQKQARALLREIISRLVDRLVNDRKMVNL